MQSFAATLLGIFVGYTAAAPLAAEKQVGVWSLVGPCSGSASHDSKPYLNPKCEDTTIPVLNEALQIECTTPGLKMAFEGLSGCPNLGCFESSSADVGSSSEDASVLVSSVSTMAVPTIMISFFTSSQDYSLPISRKPLSSLPSRFWNGASKFFFAEAFNLNASAFSSSFNMLRLIEFKDADGDGVYDPQTDAVVSEYSFVPKELGGGGQAFWLPMQTTIASANEGVSLYSFNATTNDGVFSLAFETTGAPTTVDGSTYNPKSTKVSARISHFPFKKPGTKLALETLVSVADGNAQLSANWHMPSSEATKGETMRVFTTPSSSKHAEQSGFFSWVPQASTTGGQVQVRASSWWEASDEEIKSLRASVATAAGFSGSGSATVKKVFFSFDTDGQPADLLWDPTLGYVGPPPRSRLYGLVALAIFGAAALVAVGTVVTRKLARQGWRRRSNSRQQAAVEQYDSPNQPFLQPYPALFLPSDEPVPIRQ